MRQRQLAVLAVLAVLALAAACGGVSSGVNPESSSGGAGGPDGQGEGGQSDGGQGSACTEEDAADPACRAEFDEQCSKLEHSACIERRECDVLQARRIDSELNCVEAEPEVVGCSALGCGGTLTLATDPAGGTWLFPSTCIPPGWTRTESSAPKPPECE